MYIELNKQWHACYKGILSPEQLTEIAEGNEKSYALLPKLNIDRAYADVERAQAGMPTDNRIPSNLFL